MKISLNLEGYMYIYMKEEKNDILIGKENGKKQG